MSKPKPIQMTIEEYEAHREEYNGVCLSCHAIHFGDCEPDARRYECEECGETDVYGIEEAVLMGEIEIV